MPEPQKLNMHCFTEWLALVWYGGFIDYKYNAGVKKHPKYIWPAAVLEPFSVIQLSPYR